MTFVKRRDAREAVLCMLFDYSFQADEKPEELLDMYIEHYYSEAEKNISSEIRNDKYFSQTYFGVISNINKIDEIIEKCSEKWSKARISRISTSILRIAIYEILYCDDIPVEVSVNEAVELAKKYDTDESYTFVNGVLGAAYKLITDNKQEELI